MWQDDWVGLRLDSVGNGQQSYDLFVNPLGVQGDILNDAVSAGENERARLRVGQRGTRTERGYEAEIRVPLTTVRFVERHRRPDERALLAARQPARHVGLVAGGARGAQLHGAPGHDDPARPQAPADAGGRSPARPTRGARTRASERSFGPALSDPDVGLSVKYGVTSSTSVEGTINPDFSQVESDAFQVTVNQRFPLFFSEKRPFFMEGLGTFELAGVGGDAIMRTAVHTRRVVDPFWGFKSSGSQGQLGFAVLASGDEAPGRWWTAGSNPFLGDRKEFYIVRPQYSLGPSSYAGVIFTDTEFGAGHNRVAGVDLSLKFGDFKVAANTIATRTESPSGLEATEGLGANGYFEYATKPFVFIQQVEHYDTGFQMDTAFVNQVGITQGWTFAQPSFYPEAKKYPWLKRVSPFVFFRYGQDRIQEGNSYIALAGLRLNMLRQGFFRVDYMRGQEAWVGRKTTRRRSSGRSRKRRSSAGSTSTRAPSGAAACSSIRSIPTRATSAATTPRSGCSPRPGWPSRSRTTASSSTAARPASASSPSTCSTRAPRSRWTSACRCAPSCSGTARPA